MIIGIGIDIIEMDRVKGLWKAQGLVDRLFSREEVDYFTRKGMASLHSREFCRKGGGGKSYRHRVYSLWMEDVIMQGIPLENRRLGCGRRKASVRDQGYRKNTCFDIPRQRLRRCPGDSNRSEGMRL